MYRKTLQTSVAAAALFAFAAPFAGPASAANKNVVSGGTKVHIAVTGQVGRVVAIVDDGNTTNIHHTNTNFSGTRVRFVGTAKAWESLTIGTRIEFQLDSRNSDRSGNFSRPGIADEDAGDRNNIDQRYQDITFTGRFGRFYIGKGDSASNGTTEVDLSGTNIALDVNVANAGIGGSSFIVESVGGVPLSTLGINPDPNIQALTTAGVVALGPEARTLITNFDGLSRTQRIRYDTPNVGGFKVSFGLNQGPRPDAAIRYAGTFAGTKVSAAIAWANSDSATARTGNQFGGSGSILHSSGLNFTVAAGTRELEPAAITNLKAQDDPSMIFLKAGYKAKLIDAGTTNFFVAYANHEDLQVDPFGDGSDLTYWGFGVVQILKDYATELFATFGVASLDDARTSGGTIVEFEDLTTGLFGARVKF